MIDTMPDEQHDALQTVKDVSGGTLVATVKDADGSSIGLMQTPSTVAR